MIKIYVGGFPLEMTELELVQLVSPYGEVSTIKIVRDKASGKPKGYAFLEMINREAAENVVIALDGVEIKGKSLAVSIKQDEPQPPASVYKKVERYSDPFKKKRPRLHK